MAAGATLSAVFALYAVVWNGVVLSAGELAEPSPVFELAWQCLLGVAGGGLLIAAGPANLAIADGSPLLFVGMPGHAAWLVWLLATGVRLVTARTVEIAYWDGSRPSGRVA